MEESPVEDEAYTEEPFPQKTHSPTPQPPLPPRPPPSCASTVKVLAVIDILLHIAAIPLAIWTTKGLDKDDMKYTRIVVGVIVHLVWIIPDILLFQGVRETLISRRRLRSCFWGCVALWVFLLIICLMGAMGEAQTYRTFIPVFVFEVAYLFFAALVFFAVRSLITAVGVGLPDVSLEDRGTVVSVPMTVPQTQADGSVVPQQVQYQYATPVVGMYQPRQDHWYDHFGQYNRGWGGNSWGNNRSIRREIEMQGKVWYTAPGTNPYQPVYPPQPQMGYGYGQPPMMMAPGYGAPQPMAYQQPQPLPIMAAQEGQVSSPTPRPSGHRSRSKSHHSHHHASEDEM